jgi:dolichol-phosphate mannosyltransferase
MKRKKLTVVLPAYNEAAGLSDLLERIGRVCGAAVSAYQILVVDDGSTDATSALVEEVATHLPVRLLRHERNQGLGRAVRSGLLSVLDACEVVVTMDADSSHDPELIPSMVGSLEHGYDLVIASRFRAGAAEIGVPAHRRLLSRAARQVVGGIVGLEQVRDCSSGYRAYRAELLRRVFAVHGPEGFIRERGFACMLEILLKAGAAGARVAEVPLVLRYDRKRSRSKMRIGRTIVRYAAVLGRHLLRKPFIREPR